MTPPIYTTRQQQYLMIMSTTIGLLAASAGYYFAVIRPRNRRRSEPLSPKESQLEFNELITPERCIAGDGSVMYGGELLASMDLAAASCAFRHIRKDGLGYGLVTLSIDSVKFVGSAHPYELLHLKARLNAVFNTSMEIEVVAQAENVFEGTFRDICIGRLVFVRLGGRPLPKLLITNEDDRKRKEQATKRKEESKEEARALHSSNGSVESTEKILHEFEKEWTAEEIENESNNNKDDNTKMISMADTRVDITKIVMPQHANASGYTFGGQVLAWMELAASVSAARCARAGPLITVGLDRMKFRKGVKVGSLLHMHAQVNRVFATSLEVGVRVEGYDTKQNKPIHCNTGYFTFTLIDSKTKKSRPIPRHVRPIEEEDKIRYYLAGKRRENRIKEKSE